MGPSGIWDRLAFGTVWHLGPSGFLPIFFTHTPGHSPTTPLPYPTLLDFFYIFFTFTTFLHLQLFYIYNFFTFTTFLHLQLFYIYTFFGFMLYPVLCSTRCYALPGAMLYPVLCSTRCYALPGAMLYPVLCSTRCYALPGAMLYPVLCSTRCHALPGAMLYPVLCSTRCYALPGAQKSADFLRSALCINKKPFLFRPYLKALLLIHKCINGSFPGRLLSQFKRSFSPLFVSMICFNSSKKCKFAFSESGKYLSIDGELTSSLYVPCFLSVYQYRLQHPQSPLSRKRVDLVVNSCRNCRDKRRP